MLSISKFFPIRGDLKADAVKFALKESNFYMYMNKKKEIKLLRLQNLVN